MEPTLPVLPRLDRLDRLLDLLEEKKHTKSGRVGYTMLNDNNDDLTEKMVCKTLSSALDDVQHKGTLIDRLAMLEHRVLQLSLDMEEGSTSRSSSSTVYTTKEEKEPSVDTTSTKFNGKGRKRRRVHFKWVGWFAIRC